MLYDKMLSDLTSFNWSRDKKSVFECGSLCCLPRPPAVAVTDFDLEKLDVCASCHPVHFAGIKQRKQRACQTHNMYAIQHNTKHVLLRYIGSIMDKAVSVLLDCGASDNFMSMDYAKQLNLKLTPMRPTSAKLANGTQLSIRYLVRDVVLDIGGYTVVQDYKVMEMKNLGIVLGKPWFNDADPHISWKSNTVHCRVVV